jgi:hypothetical protein
VASDQQDWRLRAELEGERGGLEQLLDGVRGQEAHDVVVTHDGSSVFAYAPTRESLDGVRETLASAFESAGLRASIRTFCWDHDLDDWVPVDPPPSADEQRAEQAAIANAEAPVTRTIVCGAGNLARGPFEQTMLAYASELGIECAITEHRHLLRTQIAFTLSGPRRKVEEFAAGCRAEGWSTVRAESAELSPIGGL